MPLRIYYLDDELDLLEMFLDTFAREDREIVVFSHPQTAIEAIQNNPPDILFLDYRLPGQNGDQIAQMLDPSIPKILVTGDLRIQSIYKFQEILEKPYSSDQVDNILDKFSRINSAK